MTIRVAMNEQQFRDLVAGKVVTFDAAFSERIELALSDIGYAVMLDALVRSLRRPSPKPDST